MKINKVILSSTNDNFFDFYPIVAKAWRNIGIEPILFLINGKIKNEKSVINVDFSNNDIDDVFLSQNIRLLAPCLFPNEVSILSDIDMMPLSKEYFINNVRNFDDDCFVNLRKDVTQNNMYPICYSVAKGNVWNDIFQVDSIESIKKLLKNWYENESNKIKNPWYFDQIKLYESVNKYFINSTSKFIQLEDKDTGFTRLNRTNLKFSFSRFYDEDQDYSDFHMPRPFKKYKKLINKVYEKNFGDF